MQCIIVQCSVEYCGVVQCSTVHRSAVHCSSVQYSAVQFARVYFHCCHSLRCTVLYCPLSCYCCILRLIAILFRLIPGGNGSQLAANCVFLLTVLTWTIAAMVLCVGGLKLVSPGSFEKEGEKDKDAKHVEMRKNFTNAERRRDSLLRRTDRKGGELSLRPGAEHEQEHDDTDEFFNRFGYTWDYALVLPVPESMQNENGVKREMMKKKNGVSLYNAVEDGPDDAHLATDENGLSMMDNPMKNLRPLGAKPDPAGDMTPMDVSPSTPYVRATASSVMPRHSCVPWDQLRPVTLSTRLLLLHLSHDNHCILRCSFSLCESLLDLIEVLIE